MTIRSRLRAAPGVVRALPWVVRARWKVRRVPDLDALLVAHDLGAGRSRPHRRPVGAWRRGVDGALRVVGPREEHCVPRALALFALLTRDGYPAVFVSGVRREGREMRGHAWVLVGEEPVEAPGGTEGLSAFREQFRFASRITREP